MPHKLDPVSVHRILGGPGLSFDSASRLCEALSVEELAGAYDYYWFRDAFGINPEVAERLYQLAILIVYNTKRIKENRKEQLSALFPKLDQKTIERIAEVEIGKLDAFSVDSLLSEFGLTEEEARVLFRWAQFKNTDRMYREVFPKKGDKIPRSTGEDDSEPTGGLTIRH